MSEHPFLDWAAALKSLKALEHEGGKNNDLVLTPLGAKRFAIGVHEAEPLLCCFQADETPLGAIKWSSAAMIFGHKNSDWIALSCKDIRIADSNQFNPVPMRLFFPMMSGRLSAWKMIKPSRLHLGVMTDPNKNGLPQFDGSPFRSLALKVIG